MRCIEQTFVIHQDRFLVNRLFSDRRWLDDEVEFTPKATPNYPQWVGSNAEHILVKQAPNFKKCPIEQLPPTPSDDLEVRESFEQKLRERKKHKDAAKDQKTHTVTVCKREELVERKL